MSSEKIVLSIQSHVTHGYVGNKAATFPLQLHGFDVDAVNTVSLSNHSGYPIIRGHRMDLEEYKTLLDGLRGNNFLHEYSYILTGYINNADIISHVTETVAEVRQLRQAQQLKDVVFVCDPVMGDDGRLYCKEEVIEAYRGILHLADIATPNSFEASILSGVTVTDMPSAIKAADWFHAIGTTCVIIKSFPVADDPGHLQFLISSKAKTATSATPLRFTGKVPLYEGRYTGTGDVFAASLVAFVHENPVEVAVGKAMAVLQDLIQATRRRGGIEMSSLDARELRVIDAPQSLLRPLAEVEVTPLANS